MIKDDFIIDFEKKNIIYNLKGSKRKYHLNEFYSFVQDLFDNPENLIYEIPIKAISKEKFVLINGWAIDEECLEHLQGGSLTQKSI